MEGCEDSSLPITEMVLAGLEGWGRGRYCRHRLCHLGLRRRRRGEASARGRRSRSLGRRFR